jgi:hypothetical protein
VQAHSGIEHNKVADLLAKEGSFITLCTSINKKGLGMQLCTLEFITIDRNIRKTLKKNIKL